MDEMRFVDRRDAGRRLANLLIPMKDEHPVVLALPRGGVPVAAEVADVLEAPLDVLIVRKLGCPWQPELGIGAIGEGGTTVLNDALISSLGLGASQIDEISRREGAEVQRRLERYRGNRSPVMVKDKTVILVDDGIATGFTARAAVEILRRRGARRIILAAPVAPLATVQRLAKEADEVIVLGTPETFFAIGQFYEDFDQVSDDEVASVLHTDSARVPTRDSLDPLYSCEIHLDEVTLSGDLTVPPDPMGLVMFAHGSGSSRFSPRNRFVANALNRGGFATLLFDLLTPDEEVERANVFDIELLGGRLAATTEWAKDRPEVEGLRVGYFGASTGAAAALVAAADLGAQLGAVVSRGGRPDLAGGRLADVRSPTLFIVGGRDEVVLELNREARRRMSCETRLEIVPGATHLFEEVGALGLVANLAEGWFGTHLK